MYNINVFVHLQIYRDKALNNKGNMIKHGMPETIRTSRWRGVRGLYTGYDASVHRLHNVKN